MSRWQPDSSRRLQEAATELYLEHGFAETTVASIAARAGLTERTYFRHFADKREVLFANEDALRDRLVEAVLAADADASPGQAATAGLDAVTADLQPRHAALRRRAPIVAAHPELRERELGKLRSWTTALAQALRDRGVAGPTAALTAEVAVAVFNVAAQRWLEQPRPGPLLVDVFATARAEAIALS
jgi:AcrR family transcriptional regulator